MLWVSAALRCCTSSSAGKGIPSTAGKGIPALWSCPCCPGQGNESCVRAEKSTNPFPALGEAEGAQAGDGLGALETQGSAHCSPKAFLMFLIKWKSCSLWALPSKGWRPLSCFCFYNIQILCIEELWFPHLVTGILPVTEPSEGSSSTGLKWFSCCKSNPLHCACVQELINFSQGDIKSGFHNQSFLPV